MITPGKLYDWSLKYNPAANSGDGAITVTLGEKSATLALKKHAKAQGAPFDHFGLFSSGPGGQMVKIFLDDLQYTTAPSPRSASTAPATPAR